MKDENLTERLRDEADQARQDGADDIAKLLDEAASAIASIHAQQVPAGIDARSVYAAMSIRAHTRTSQENVGDVLEALAKLTPASTGAGEANPAVPVSAIRQIAVEAIRAVTGCPDIRGSDGRYLVDEFESVAKAAAETFAAHHAPSPVAQGWLPIETAPKDGTHVLLWGKYWNGRDVFRRPLAGLWDANSSEWFIPSEFRFKVRPTHWQTLPAAPGTDPTQCPHGVDDGGCKACYHEATQRSSEPAQGDERFAWSDFQDICDQREVEEAIRALLENQDNDNAVCLVRAVVEAAGERLVRLATTQPTQALKRLTAAEVQRVIDAWFTYPPGEQDDHLSRMRRAIATANGMTLEE